MFSGSNFGYWLSKSLDLFKGQVIEFLVINSRESSLHRQVYRYTYVWKFRFFGCNSCTHCRPVFFFATNDLIQENCRLWTCFRNAGIKAMSRGILFHAKCTARVWTSFTTVLLSMRTSTVQWSLLPKICHLKKFFIFCCLNKQTCPRFLVPSHFITSLPSWDTTTWIRSIEDIKARNFSVVTIYLLDLKTER